jgi:hypothetical protein
MESGYAQPWFYGMSQAFSISRNHPYTTHGVPVWVGPATQRVPGWVHAYRLSKEQANRARQACYQRNSKKGHTPQARTVALAAWVLVWTSIAPAQLDGETILRLYRLRWQVEVGIKRWKSLLDVDALRARQGRPLAELWLHGKLLYPCWSTAGCVAPWAISGAAWTASGVRRGGVRGSWCTRPWCP